MSRFAPELNGKNKNVYFGTKKMKPFFLKHQDFGIFTLHL